MMRPRVELEGSDVECCDVVSMTQNLHRPSPATSVRPAVRRPIRQPGDVGCSRQVRLVVVSAHSNAPPHLGRRQPAPRIAGDQ